MQDFGLKSDVVNFIVDEAHKHDMDKVVLFGSRARGTFSERSDIDLAASGPELQAYRASLEERCPTLLSFDVVDLSRKMNSSLGECIANEGVVLYDIELLESF